MGRRRAGVSRRRKVCSGSQGDGNAFEYQGEGMSRMDRETNDHFASVAMCHDCHEHCSLDGRQSACGKINRAPSVSQTLPVSAVIPQGIESTGFYHALPGTRTLSVSLADSSPKSVTWPLQLDGLGEIPRIQTSGTMRFSLSELLDLARQDVCDSVLLTGVDPAFTMDAAVRVFQEAAKRDLIRLVHSSGFLSLESVRRLAPLVDGVSLFVGSLLESTAAQRQLPAPRHLRQELREFHARGVWLEVRTVLHCGVNDSRQELLEMALSVRDIDASIPWHLRVADSPNADAQTASDALSRAVAVAEEVGLSHVYSVGGKDRGRELTFCHICQDVVLIERYLGRSSSRMGKGFRCPRCRTRAQGLFARPSESAMTTTG